ncbi:hypothetical protein ACQEVF_15050 [Nonomuraea polychroma]|uniref:hypothetical protein n=1 Tax=Nonomuraea polychroma TaxID=46176 RepID=UPI003D943CDF
MEDQLGALSLVLNCVTLWNTVYTAVSGPCQMTSSGALHTEPCRSLMVISSAAGEGGVPAGERSGTQHALQHGAASDVSLYGCPACRVHHAVFLSVDQKFRDLRLLATTFALIDWDGPR